jgi:hypothetical protein
VWAHRRALSLGSSHLTSSACDAMWP